MYDRHQESMITLLRVLYNNQRFKKKTIVTMLSKRLDYTYSYLSKELERLEKMGIITTQKHKRVRFVEITELGLKVFDAYSNVKMILDREGIEWL